MVLIKVLFYFSFRKTGAAGEIKDCSCNVTGTICDMKRASVTRVTPLSYIHDLILSLYYVYDLT